jgi:tetratricopeptide (TPR) repeat protein
VTKANQSPEGNPPGAAPLDSPAEATKLVQEGWQLWQARKLPEAEGKFQKAVEISPTNAEAWNGLGWAQFNQGKNEEGEKAFQQAVAINPEQFAALNGLGQIYVTERRYDEAEKFLLQAAPRASAAWFGLARLYLLEGKFEEAEKWAQQIVDSGQADAIAQKMLEAAKAKHLSEGLRLMIEPPPAASPNMTDDARTSPFRDTAKYLSPFTAVHFDINDINKVVVAYNGSEYGLAAIDDLPVADILDFCRRQYGRPQQVEGWAQKRFAEDLAIVLSDMKHPVNPDNTVSLTLVDPKTGQQTVIAHAQMTAKNREAIFRDRTLINSNLLQSALKK